MCTSWTKNITAPFKYDIVGSFLRPDELKNSRADYAAGRISKEELREVEDRLIIDLIHKQQAHGLYGVTDGEFRRRWWHLDFLEQLNGVTKYSLGDIRTFQNVEMKNAEAYYVSGKLSFSPSHSFLQDFVFLKDHAGDRVAKQTIPGPNMLYLGGAILSARYQENPVYDELSQLEEAIVATYQEAIQAFYDVGCRYLQLDDTAWGRLLDQDLQSPLAAAAGNHSVEALIEKCAEITRRSIENKPEDMVITFHFCRGNFKSSWVYEGGYDAIAEQLLAIEDFDGFFLEYDTERAGSFAPLKHLKNQKVVLGLITSKTPELEDPRVLLEKMKQASEYVPLQQICLSPQCGFASTEEGNALTEEQQWAKIDLLVETAALLETL